MIIIHPAGVSDVQAESAACLDPDQLTNFLHQTLVEVKQALRDLQLEESRKRELSSALHSHSKDWLYGSTDVYQLLHLGISVDCTAYKLIEATWCYLGERRSFYLGVILDDNCGQVFRT